MEVTPQAIDFCWKHPLQTSCLVIMVDFECGKCLNIKFQDSFIHGNVVKYGEHIVKHMVQKITTTWDVAAFVV